MTSTSATSEPKVEGVAALVLTGGASRRLGRDKATLPIGGTTFARHLVGQLARVVHQVVEVGPGYCEVPFTREEPPGTGPLAALAAGWEMLRESQPKSVLVVACDLPLLNEDFIRFLAERPTGASVIPVVDARLQLLSARYSPSTLDQASKLIARGQFAVSALLATGPVELLGPRSWAKVATTATFQDVDTPADWHLLSET